MTALHMGGFIGFSTVDYPGLHAAVVFCQGCSWACRYCHNGHLQVALSKINHVWEDVIQLLARRHDMLDAVVFSGGEPTLQAGLVEAIGQVKAMGYAVGLHTGGSHPACLASALPLLDWVGFDLKAPWLHYESLTGVRGSGQAAKESLEHLLASGVSFELRTTLHGELLSQADLKILADLAGSSGASNWVIQPFRPQGCHDETLLARPSPSMSQAHAEVLAQARVRYPNTCIHVRGESSPTCKSLNVNHHSTRRSA